MRLSTKARYAVMAAVDIGQQERNTPVSLTVIADRQNLPLPYLEQLFVKLRKAGIVKSARGASGGYTLVHSPDKTRILDIIKAVDTPMKATRCKAESAAGCQEHGQRCVTHDLWDELGALIQVFLNKVTIADVCNKRVLGMGRFGVFASPSEMEGKGL